MRRWRRMIKMRRRERGRAREGEREDVKENG
jgi:hypothetical protein